MRTIVLKLQPTADQTVELDATLRAFAAACDHIADVARREHTTNIVLIQRVCYREVRTSRTCSECRHCEKANRKSQAEFLCKHCGFSANADWNAARNIRALAASKAATELAIVEAKAGNGTAAEISRKATTL